MTDEFARRYHNKTGREFDSVGRRIRFVVIYLIFEFRISLATGADIYSVVVSCTSSNIATQKFISTYSKFASYEPDTTTNDEPEYWDIVGLIRAIAVKVHILLNSIPTWT